MKLLMCITFSLILVVPLQAEELYFQDKLKGDPYYEEHYDQSADQFKGLVAKPTPRLQLQPQGLENRAKYPMNLEDRAQYPLELERKAGYPMEVERRGEHRRRGGL